MYLPIPDPSSPREIKLQHPIPVKGSMLTVNPTILLAQTNVSSGSTKMILEPISPNQAQTSGPNQNREHEGIASKGVKARIPYADPDPDLPLTNQHRPVPTRGHPSKPGGEV